MVNAIENEVEKTYAGIDDSIRTLENAQRKIVDL